MCSPRKRRGRKRGERASSWVRSRVRTACERACVAVLSFRSWSGERVVSLIALVRTAKEKQSISLSNSTVYDITSMVMNRLACGIGEAHTSDQFLILCYVKARRRTGLGQYRLHGYIPSSRQPPTGKRKYDQQENAKERSAGPPCYRTNQRAGQNSRGRC